MDYCGGEEEIELSLGLSIGGGGGGCRKKVRTEDRVSEAPVVGVEVDDLIKRKELQAQRRQEARRKREEKKQMKRNGVVRSAVDDGDERGAKREKIDSELLSEKTVKSDGAADQSCSGSAYAFPIYAYPSTFQYVPFANGFAFPCIAPMYRAESAASHKIADVNQTVSFRPFQGGNKNSLNDEGNAKAVSNGSAGYCSSAVSENRSISSRDGSSSDSASHLSRIRSTKTELHSSSGSDVPGTSNQKAFSNKAEKSNNYPPATLFQPISTKVVSKVDSTAVELKPANVPIRRLTSLPQPKTPVTNDNKADSSSPGKPPRPQPDDNQKSCSPLSQMPCVSATGNGPDGKTITGFLYRYNTTAEVSIVCVCHGESFSPAEFVKHAGGIDIAHPLRHITVVPSAF